MPRPWTAGLFVAVATMGAAVDWHAAAAAEPSATKTDVRSGNHPDFGRVVIDTIGQIGYHIEQDGDHVLVRFDDGIALGNPPALPRNVIGLRTNGAFVDLTLKHGAALHSMRLGGRVVLDALDAPDRIVHAPKLYSLASLSPTRPGTAVRTTDAPHRSPSAESPIPVAPARPATEGSTVTGGPATVAAVASGTKPIAKPLPPEAQHAPLAANTGAAVTGSDGRSAAAATKAPPLPFRKLPPESDALLISPLPVERVPVVAQPLPATAPQPLEKVAGPAPVEKNPGVEEAGPLALRARRVKLPKELDGSAFLVPFDATTGASAFQTASAAYLVFDERRPVDLAALRNDPVFGAVSVQLLANGTLFRMPLPPGLSTALTQMPQGWRIAALTTTSGQHPIVAAFADGRLNLTADQPGKVISMTDPDTGATLLIGTQHRPGQGILGYRRSAEFILRPTTQGIVVEPLSDSISLRPVPTGFILAAGPEGLHLSPALTTSDLLMDAARLSRRLTLPTMPTEVSMQLALKQLSLAAAAPPLARGPKHRVAAESFLALGFSAEAEALLRIAAEQDPKEAGSVETRTLTAVAALMAGRPQEANALSDPALDGTDEIAFWRAVRQSMRDDGSPAAAAVFATTAPLMLQYPATMREHLLPLVVETMIKGGEIAPAARLLKEYKEFPKLSYARALMRLAEGNTSEALGMLDTLAAGHDQFDHARAAARAVELRLAARSIDKTQAADALDKLLYAWRGDGRELALRQRVAELRGQAGAWRAALTTLRQAEIDFPEQAAPIHQRLKDMFAQMVRDEGTRQIPPIEFVSMVDENADLSSATGDDDEPIEQALADRLSALDLPGRAKPVLEKLLRSAKSDVAKARFGASLAALESREGNDAAARAVLNASDTPVLPPDLAEQRAILLARSVGRLGDAVEAAGLLVPFGSIRAKEVRAQILEDGGGWAEAAKVWTEIVGSTVSDDGPLDEARGRTILRLATAAARAGDESGLANMRAKFGDRFGPGPAGDLFRVLTAVPIRTSADIQRSKRETGVAATLSGGLKTM